MNLNTNSTVPSTAYVRSIPFLCWVVFVAGSISVAAENTTYHFAKSLIGKSATEIIDELGNPQIFTPGLIRYANGPTLKYLSPRVPQGTDSIGAGANLIIPPGHPSVSSDFCTLDLTLSPNGTVADAQASGPGCFNFTHWLKHRPAP